MTDTTTSRLERIEEAARKVCRAYEIRHDSAQIGFDIHELSAALAAQPTQESGEESTDILVQRAYPGLKRWGSCSRHRDDGHYSCTICYPDQKQLLAAHMAVSDALYGDLLSLSGLADPPNGRVGTNAIVAALRAQLTAARELRRRLDMKLDKDTGRISYTVTQCAVAEFDSVMGAAG